MAGIFHRQAGPDPDSYRDYRDGRPLVLLHGFCETSEIWSGLTPLLSHHFLVVTPDLPGFGKSEALRAPFTLAEVADALHSWIEAHPFDRAVVIGHSLGGYVALAMAKSRPGGLAGLGLFHSTALADSEEKKANRDKVIDFVSRNGVAPFIETYVPGLFARKDSTHIPAVRSIGLSTPKETLIAYAMAMRDRPDQTAVLKTFAKPVLLIAGEKDEVIPLSSLEKQALLGKKTSISTLPGTGHMGMFEAREKSAQIIEQFVASCP